MSIGKPYVTFQKKYAEFFLKYKLYLALGIIFFFYIWIKYSFSLKDIWFAIIISLIVTLFGYAIPKLTIWGADKSLELYNKNKKN
jgi:hypothetical protein